MKKFIVFFILVFISLSIYGQETYIGRINIDGAPAISEPYDFYLVFGLRTFSKQYHLEINSNMVLDGDPLIVDGIEYFNGDEVEITGIATTHIDLWGLEYHVLEVISIKKLHRERGQIIGMGNPATTNPPLPGIVFGFETPSDAYVLTINASWIWSNETFIFDGIEYFEGDEVEILGETTTKLDINSNEYTEFEIISIRKLISEQFVGKIIGDGTPSFSNYVPIVPCEILWIETASGNYVLNFEHWICDEGVIVDSVLYCWEDEVEVTGIVTRLGIDIYNVEQFDLEVETIKKLVPDDGIYTGKIISGSAPSLTLPPPSAETVLALEVPPHNFCFYNYILTIDSEWIQSDVLLFDGITYAIGDEVEITGVTYAKETDYTTKYIELEIETIKKTIGLESVSINDKVYYDRTSQCIVIEKTLQDQPLTFELVDIHGRIVLQKTAINNNNAINVSKLLQGVYLYRLTQNGQVIKTDKLLIDK